MFCAIWIQPEHQHANKRVVVVRPHKDKPPWLKSPTAAWAVLRAAIREERTGCIVAGTEEALPQCLSAIEKDDQSWPSDAARMVAAITQLAGQHHCTVIFRQNLKPESVKPAPGASVGSIQLEDAQPVWTVVGSPAAVSATLAANKHVHELARISPARVKVGLAGHEITAAQNLNESLAGVSFSERLNFEQSNEMLDLILGPKAKKYKFLLLVKDQSHSIIFLGAQASVVNIRQAIAAYVVHLRGGESDPQEAADTDESFENEPDVPRLGNCRFWRLHR